MLQWRGRRREKDKCNSDQLDTADSISADLSGHYPATVLACFWKRFAVTHLNIANIPQLKQHSGSGSGRLSCQKVGGI